MKLHPARLSFVALAVLALVAVPARPARSQSPAPSLEERLAAVKKSFAESQAALRGYEWVETTVVSVKGEEKSRTLQRCYYGADGALQKTPISAEQAKAPGGLRGVIAGRKKEQLTDYLQAAVDLVRRYVPPDPGMLQTSKEAGNASLALVEPGRRGRLDFHYYFLPDDAVGITINLSDNTLAGLSISSFLGKEKDPVSLAVDFGKLEGGITYASRTVLEAKAKGVAVTVTNSGFLKLAR